MVRSADPARIKFRIFIECFMETKAGVFCMLFSSCFTVPLCLCPHLQVALYIWGWCSEPSFGADFQTKWAVNSACWSPWLSTVSSPSCHPLSKATACSSFVAWCPALGEYYVFSRGLTQEESGREPPPPAHHVRGWKKNENETDLGTVMNICFNVQCLAAHMLSKWPDITLTWHSCSYMTIYTPSSQTSCYWATQYYMGCS